VDFPVAYSAEGFDGQTRAKQLSEFGVLIGPLDQPQRIAERHVRLEFTLPGHEKIQLKGFCSYVTPTAAGIRFDPMPEKIKNALERFVNGLPPEG
jgi:hypothetical protein